MTTETTTTAPGFAGFFRTNDSDSGRADYCSIEAALKLGLVQPHHQEGFLYTRSQGKLPYKTAISMGLIDAESAAIIKASTDNVFRPPRVVIETAPQVTPVGPMGAFEGTAAGAVADALRKYVASRSEEDLAGFARALAAALDAR